MIRGMNGAAWLVFGLVVLPFGVSAQGPAGAQRRASSVQNPSATPSPATPYVPPTQIRRFHDYLHNTFGPLAWVRTAASAGINQASDSPPEWGQGAAGYGRRFGSAFGTNLIAETTSYGFSALLREDNTYYPCECHGFFPRLEHAILSGFTARKTDGHRVLSISRLAGPYAGGFISVAAWYPSRFGVKDGFRQGSIALATSFGFPIAREFIFRPRKH